MCGMNPSLLFLVAWGNLTNTDSWIVLHFTHLSYHLSWFVLYPYYSDRSHEKVWHIHMYFWTGQTRDSEQGVRDSAEAAGTSWWFCCDWRVEVCYTWSRLSWHGTLYNINADTVPWWPVWYTWNGVDMPIHCIRVMNADILFQSYVIPHTYYSLDLIWIFFSWGMDMACELLPTFTSLGFQ